jgi:hypothetical protein
MPPRIAVAGILAFWLATTAFVVYRDVWPRLFASGPPPVTIELADEARQNAPAKWSLYRNPKPGDRPLGTLSTQMKYRDADDSFLFTYRYNRIEFAQSGIKLLLLDATTEVVMTRAGDLKEQTMSAKVDVQMGDKSVATGTIDIRGTVSGGALTGRAEIKSTLANVIGDLDPVPVKAGLPLNPLQPVNRLGNVRGGLEWVVSESNPMQDAVSGLFRKKLAEFGLRVPEEKQKESLLAKVGREPQPLTRRGEEFACWVIEYRRAEVVARTWVRVSDGKVMRQEAFEKGETLVFERED